MDIPSTPYLDEVPTSARFKANMYSTPRRSHERKGYTPSATPGSKSRLKGLFKDNQWFCDCEPRLPAVRFQVKKNNKNRNKWFYTCQQDRKKQCGFFLWEDDAQVREKGALLSNTGTESKYITSIGPGEPPIPSFAQTPSTSRFPAPSRPDSSADLFGDDGSEISTGDELDMASLADNMSQTRRRLFSPKSTTSNSRTQEGHQANTGKRKRGDSMFVGESEDDDFGGNIGSDEEKTMISLTDSASQSQQKRSRPEDKPGQFTTPSMQRTHDVIGGLPTPSTRHSVGRNSLLLAAEDRDAKRQKMSTPPTPSVGRASAVAPTPPVVSGQGDGDDYEITQEVMGLLSGTRMTDDVRSSVRRSLNRHALKLKGVERGREMVRLTVKAKDLKIEQLQEQVKMLESEKNADRERIEELIRTGAVDHTALKGFKDEYGYNSG
jgi:hypothetical protein